MKIPRVDPNEIIGIIDDELRKAGLSHGETVLPRGKSSHPFASKIKASDLQILQDNKATSSFSIQNTYDIDTFLNYNDTEFIINAYRGILRRHPDPVGWEHYLNALRSGERSKIEILGRLRYSPEGRSKRVKIRGLLIPFVIQSSYHIPILGYLIHWLIGLAHLPTIIRNWQRFEAFTHSELMALGSASQDANKVLASKMNEIIDAQTALTVQMEELRAAFEELKRDSRHPGRKDDDVDPLDDLE